MVGDGQVRAQADGLLEVGQRLRALGAGKQGQPEISPRQGGVGLQLHGSAEVANRLSEGAELLEHDTCVGVCRGEVRAE